MDEKLIKEKYNEFSAYMDHMYNMGLEEDAQEIQSLVNNILTVADLFDLVKN